MTDESFDVLIVGAGLSGIGAACHLQRRCPDHTWAILEARGSIGGTWDLFRYPGVRSDSDLYTFGYSFRPWTGDSTFASGDAIRQYVEDTAEEHGITPHIQFRSRVVCANWNSRTSRWELDVRHGVEGETRRLQCRFLFLCAGYYRYLRGHTPDFPRMKDFQGRIVDPQRWPQNFDFTDQKVVIIGSGATAVTLLPAMAQQAAHVTMLQRSPTYILPLPSKDLIAALLHRVLPEKMAYWLTRAKNVCIMTAMYQFARILPYPTKDLIRLFIRWHLGSDFDVDRHFEPTYAPWDQRLCIAPDGDFFQALKQPSASIVTDYIRSFTESGILLQSGGQLDADVVVMATGLELQAAGGMTLKIDGRPQATSQLISYRGMMLAPLPNLAVAQGYVNASWTLKVDLICERVCRILNHMQRKGYVRCVPVPPADLETSPGMPLTSGYVQRAISQLPRQGNRSPWITYQNYFWDLLKMRWTRLEDGALQFFREPDPQEPTTASADQTDETS